jgi:Zn finger protein HypA/HybF involved in hydrogenase expression
MALNPEQIAELLKMIRETEEVELSCPDCLDALDVYIQSVEDGRPIEGLLERVRDHLAGCPFCKSEYDLIVETLNSMEE